MATPDNDVVEVASAFPFAETIVRLVEAIETAGMTLFARIDHAEAAHRVGLAMLPATVLIYGNPRGGTPIMLNTPNAALDLPLRVLVREREDGGAVIAFHPVAAMLGRAGVPEDVAVRLAPAQQILRGAVTQ